MRHERTTHRITRRTTRLAVLAALVAGCQSPPPRLMVGLATDLFGVADPLATAELTVKQGQAVLVDKRLVLPAGMGQDVLPAAVSVTTAGGDPLTLSLVGTLASGKLLVRKATLPVPDYPTRFFRMMLLADCLDPSTGQQRSCPLGDPEEGCIEGQCAPIAFDSSRLPFYVNGIEGSVDCGGVTPKNTATSVALPTLEPGHCVDDAACIEDTCYGKSPLCDDGVKDGTETGVDCGGGCAPCADGSACVGATDCASGVCGGSTCAAPTCHDGVENGSETDVDCGGSCAPCAPGRACKTVVDCSESVCKAGTCVAYGCTDGIKDLAETDVDCGGGTCGRCPLGKACAVATDCASGRCTAAACVALLVPGNEYAAGSSPAGIAAGDFDNDGLVDLAVVDAGDVATRTATQGTGGIVVLKGRGDGSFSPLAIDLLLANASDDLDAVRAADLDHDGNLDLVATTDHGGAACVFHGLGSGAFSFDPTVDEYGMGVGPLPVTGLAIADWNGDGVLDFGVANGAGFGYRLGVGMAMFDSMPFLVPTDQTKFSAVAVAAGRLTGAPGGPTDAVVVSAGQDTASALLFGAATVTKVTNFPAGAGPADVVVADVSGDGKPDAIVADQAGAAIAVLVGDGMGGFSPPLSFPTTLLPTRIAVADFDGDGTLDVEAIGPSTSAGATALLVGLGQGRFGPASLTPLAFLPVALVAADVDGDGRPDLALTDAANGQVSIERNPKP